MLFSSFEFIFLFLPLTLFGYFLFGKISARSSNIFLLIASFIFYGWWDIRYIPLLVVSIFLNFFSGIIIAKSRGLWRKIFLFISISINMSSWIF